MSTRIVVRGGAPGLVRVELDDGSAGTDIDADANAYTALQALAPFVQALLDAANAPKKVGT